MQNVHIILYYGRAWNRIWRRDINGSYDGDDGVDNKMIGIVIDLNCGLCGFVVSACDNFRGLPLLNSSCCMGTHHIQQMSTNVCGHISQQNL